MFVDCGKDENPSLTGDHPVFRVHYEDCGRFYTTEPLWREQTWFRGVSGRKVRFLWLNFLENGISSLLRYVPYQLILSFPHFFIIKI